MTKTSFIYIDITSDYLIYRITFKITNKHKNSRVTTMLALFTTSCITFPVNSNTKCSCVKIWIACYMLSMWYKLLQQQILCLIKPEIHDHAVFEIILAPVSHTSQV